MSSASTERLATTNTNGSRPALRDRNWTWFALLLASSLWALVPGISPLVADCLIAHSLFFVIKAHVFDSHNRRSGASRSINALNWFFLWPGLDAAAFARRREHAVDASKWLAAITKTMIGFGICLVGVPLAAETSEFVRGWTILVGLVMTLHFGLFHLVALVWQSRSRDVRPIMNSPLLATSVNDFWTHRWNLAFRDYASKFLFVPLARSLSPTVAVIVGYLFSGIIHELAISVPAGGGYGLPTAYFLIQAVGILTERRLRRSGIDLTTGFRGRIWAVLIVAPGVLVLFPPPFVTAVAAPLADLINSVVFGL